MAVIKCKMCGGDLVIEPGATVAECEYCGTKQTIPNQDDEKKLTLFARANRLRMGCEFDKAAGIYEAIVADFPQEAEAYWGLVLCKYGIEYVDDPATGKKIPTCHRSSFESIMEDSDFEQALENADVVARKVYRDEAKQIEEIRKGIIEVSGREEPYDIFICYKETDENGQRTVDSVIAQDVYDALTEKGYRVFFSRITLEDKLGQEYEPYIFAALNSAKIMLAFGTDYEYYNAVWVKNEWSRYLKLMAKDKTKHLIPCYKGIDAYDMPKEFAKLQAQDMGKVGAMQDLMRGIEKILNASTLINPDLHRATQEAVRTIEQEKSKKQVENAVSLGVLAAESGDVDKAREYFENALSLDSECIGAYLGLTRIITDSNKVVPYVQKLTSIPISQILDYIKLNRRIIGNLQNDNNLLTTAIKTIHSEDLVQGILNLGIEGDAKNALIHYLCNFKNVDTIKMLIDSGSDVNATIWWSSNYEKSYDSYFGTYHESYCREHHSVLSTAIDACQSRQIIELLVNAGADVNYSIEKYNYWHKVGETSAGSLARTTSVLALAATKSDDIDIAKVLIEAGANVNYIVHESENVDYPILSYAVFNNKQDLAKLLLECGADPNQKRKCPRKYSYHDYDNDICSSAGIEEYSPISDAIWNIKDIAMLKLLVSHGGNPNLSDRRVVVKSGEGDKRWLCGFAKYYPIIDALIYAEPEFVEILLDNGANPHNCYNFEGIQDYSTADVVYKSSFPALGIAVLTKNQNNINSLIKAGASFSDEATYQTRGNYSSGSYAWKEDRFPLSKYAFSDEVITEVGNLIQVNGWRGRGFLGKRHCCIFWT